MIAIINETIVERHAGDAAFLWMLRDRAIVSPRYTHRQMQALDGRIDAHLDGLRIAGDFGWGCCVQQLRDWGEPDEVFAAAALAFDVEDDSRWSVILDRAMGDQERERAIVAACGWHSSAQVEPRLRTWSGSSESGLRALGLGGLLAHRVDPGPELGETLSGSDPRLVALAVRAAGELGRVDLVGALREHLRSPLRLDAARALARLGVDEAGVIEALLSVAEAADEADAEPAIDSLVRLSPELGRDCFRRWRERAPDRTRAIHAAAALGLPEVVEDLLEWMRDDDLARLGGRAFSAIVGVDLEYADLQRKPPRVHDEDDDDIPVEDPRVAGLAWPSVFAAARWWRDHSQQFSPTLRYLAGKPIGSPSTTTPTASDYADLLALTKSGRPWWRMLASRCLAQSFNELPRIETRAPTGKLHTLPGLAAWPATRIDPDRVVLDVG